MTAATLHWFGRTSGSTRDERERNLRGDDLVLRPTLVTDHAITIDAPRERVWPWLVQMGWHRGGWYTARWVDQLLFPANWPSAGEIVPELQHLAVGDFVPDGPPDSECGFTVTALEPARRLVLFSRTHLPPSWAERFDARMEWSWTFALDDIDGASRLLVRSRARIEPAWVGALYWLAAPADFVMATQMLRGIKHRAGR